MDLEIFENPDEISISVPHQHPSAFSAKEALEHIDEVWYILANKRARWMDLIGDYAGSEPFIIDGTSCSRRYCYSSSLRYQPLTGESLLQIVLDDPLLAIGRDGGMYTESLL